MKKSEEMIDAEGGVVPLNSMNSRISLKEAQCYAVISTLCSVETYIHNPASVVYESILWGSRMLKSHPLYWSDKRKLLTRILRSANTSLFQQCKDHIGVNAVDAMVGFRGNTQLWLAIVGQVSVWSYCGVMKKIYPLNKNTRIPPLGFQRYAFAPYILSIPIESYGNTIVTTGSISTYLEKTTFKQCSTEEMKSIFSSIESDGAWIIIPHTRDRLTSCIPNTHCD